MELEEDEQALHPIIEDINWLPHPIFPLASIERTSRLLPKKPKKNSARKSAFSQKSKRTKNSNPIKPQPSLYPLLLSFALTRLILPGPSAKTAPTCIRNSIASQTKKIKTPIESSLTNKNSIDPLPLRFQSPIACERETAAALWSGTPSSYKGKHKSTTLEGTTRGQLVREKENTTLRSKYAVAERKVN